ncbi:myosin-10-like [Stylophora pistillata]|nr:myosin-10-like [Stylophora pistillata]
MRLQSQISNTLLVKNQQKDLQSKIERLEEERNRLKEDLRNSSVGSRDRYSGADLEYQDIQMVRQRYEEEKRSKIRLANDMKYLLADITDLKERNHRLQDDFLRERMEIKAMIEKQANEITQEYLTQISKLQRSLIDETKRRQEAEAGRNGLIYSEENHTSCTGVQTDMNSRSGQGNNDFQVQLANEIRRRENLEVENKKLLYKLNEILSADANHKGIDHANFKGATLRGNQTHNVGSSINNQESVKKRQELQSEIDDLPDKLEVSKNEAKKNKELKRKNEDLEEEVTRVTRKRDELLAGQRNLTREVDHLSRTLEDVERRNRKLSEEAERFTRKIQELEDSFLQEKITLTRNYENEKARAVEEVTKAKEACERRLQVQTETTRRLEEKILRLEGQISASVGTQTGGSLTTLPSDNGATKDRRSRIIHSQDEKLKEEVEHLEAMLKDANKKHADDLKNLEAQKRRMSEEFDRERQSLEKYFEKENRTLKQRLQDVESSIRGDGVGFIGIEGESREHSISNLGRRSPPNIEGTKDLPRFQSRNEIYGKKSKESEFQQKVQEMERRYDEEKRDILNRASREKAKLEDEVREAKEKLTSYRRLLEDEIEDLKRKHRKEIDILNEELLKQRAEFEERLRTAECTVSRGMIGASTIYDNSNHFDQINETRREDGLQDKKSPKAMVGTSGTKRDRYGFQEFDRAFSQEPGNPNDVGARDGKSTKITSQYGFEDDNRVGRGRKTVEDGMGGRAGLENETIVYREETRDYQSQSQNEKRKFMEAIHSLTQEVNALKNEKKEMKNCFKKEMEKLTKVNDVEKKTIRERAERDKDDEVTRVKENYEEKLASERKRLQGNIDEFRRKIALTEKKVRDMEAQQRNERMRYQEQKMNAEKSLIQSQDELKIKLERDYRKMLIDEKQKFEQTIKGLTTQISFLQNQRKEIQDKLHKNDVAANASAKTEQESRSRMVIQMEHEFFERVQREKRPLEDKIKDLQQEINKLRREKSELSDVLEGEKQELENEREKMQAEMKRKLSKAREDMERKANVIGKHMVATPVKSVLVGSETCHHCAQSDVRQYKEQINLVEQRNMTLKTKTERLERELRVIGDRLKTLEVRNKDLETANREEMSYGKDVFRSGSGRYGESDIRGANDLSTGSMISGMRTETRIFQPNLSPRLSLANGSSLSGSGLSYGDILDKVRYTMHTTGGIYDALRGPMASTSGMVSGGFLGGTSSALRHGNPITGGTLNQSTVSSLGIRNIEVSSSLGNVGGNLIAEGVGGASYGREGNHSPSER